MTSPTDTREHSPVRRTLLANPATAIGVLLLTGVLSLGALLGPNLVANEVGMEMSMNMTHYMELLAVHQPRNLLILMAVPVILAETLAITELAILLRRAATPAWVRTTSRVAGSLAGPVMLAIFLNLMLNARRSAHPQRRLAWPCRRHRGRLLPGRRGSLGRDHPRRTRPDRHG